jgi:hypothetical protein
VTFWLPAAFLAVLLFLHFFLARFFQVFYFLLTAQMNTNKKRVVDARINREFCAWVKGLLAYRGMSLSSLAVNINRSRGAVSRAVNRGEFHKVQSEIKIFLSNEQN